MTNYTVTYAQVAQDDLAREWIDAPNRGRVADAANEIDRQLRLDASTKGEAIGKGWRRLIILPLIVEFTVEEDDRMVAIWSVRSVEE